MKKYILAAALVLASTSAMADRIIYVIDGKTNVLAMTIQPNEPYYGVTISGNAVGRNDKDGKPFKSADDIKVNSVPLEISQFIEKAIFSRTPIEIGIDRENHNFAYAKASSGGH